MNETISLTIMALMIAALIAGHAGAAPQPGGQAAAVPVDRIVED